MAEGAGYRPGRARGARVEKDGQQKDGERWTLILVRELRHPPELVWEALTDPAQLAEWAPYDADRSLAAEGAAKLTWTGTGQTVEAAVTRAEAGQVLELGEMRWELEAMGGGTRLTLWHTIDRRYVTWGAAGWHIAFDVLERLLAGAPMGRLAGAAAMRSAGWPGLVAEYAEMFGAEEDGQN